MRLIKKDHDHKGTDYLFETDDGERFSITRSHDKVHASVMGEAKLKLLRIIEANDTPFAYESENKRLFDKINNFIELHLNKYE